jgi:hypothetical protein
VTTIGDLWNDAAMELHLKELLRRIEVAVREHGTHVSDSTVEMDPAIRSFPDVV